MHIGSKIKALVVENSKISLVELANKIGYSEPGMYDIFKKEDVSTKILKLFSKELNISLSDFFNDNSNKYDLKTSKSLSLLNEPAVNYNVDYKQKYFDLMERHNKLLEEVLILKDPLNPIKKTKTKK